MDTFDVTIVGGGAVGLFGAFYAGLRGVKTKIIESLPQLGGQLSALYPEKYVFDVAGYQAVLAKDLAAELIKQGLQFDPTVVLGEEVLTLERTDDGWKLTTTRGEHLSKTVVITIGIGAFSPRKLPLEGLERFEANGDVDYTVSNLDDYRDRRVLVVGGGDSAVDWANMLEPVAASVTLIHRRDRFRAHEASVEQMKNSSVTIKTPFEAKALVGTERLEGVTIYRSRTTEEETLPVDKCIFSLGFTSDMSNVARWGLEMDKNTIVVNNFKMETNLPGVFAAGDVASYDGKIKLIATGFGEVANAVNYAVTLIDPTARQDPGHSTSRRDLQPITAGS